MSSPLSSPASSSASFNAASVNSQTVTSDPSSNSTANCNANATLDSNCAGTSETINNANAAKEATGECNISPGAKSCNSNSNSNSNNSSSNNSTPSNRPLRLRRVNHPDEVVSGLGKLLKSGVMTDVTLSCQNGLSVRAHRVILSTFSPYFKAIFDSPPFTQMPWIYPVVIMRDFAFYEVKAIIEFIYKGEVSVPREKLQSVLATAKALEVSGLADLKAENFGLTNCTTRNANCDSGAVNGNGLQGGNIGGSFGGSLTPSGGGTKRSALSSSSLPSDLDASQYNATTTTANDSIASVVAKKLRRAIEVTNSDVNCINSNALSPLTSAFALGNNSTSNPFGDFSSLESMKHILNSQSNVNLNNSLLEQLVQQQLTQQAQLQQLATLGQSTQGTRGISSFSRNNNLVQQTNDPGHGKSKSNSHLTQLKQQFNSRNLPQNLSPQVKQQILQQQFLRSNRSSLNSSPASNMLNHPFLELQQRVLQQMKGKNSAQNTPRNLTVNSKGKNSSKGNNCPTGEDDDDADAKDKLDHFDRLEDASDDEANTGDGDVDEGDGDSSYGHFKKDSIDGETIDNDDGSNQLVVRDEDDMDAEDEEYEIEMDKDSIFQQQQQLRLQQIQQQQRQYALQLQLDQEEQEQRLLESLTNSRNGKNTDDTDADDTGSGFDWQEGFTDDLPYGRDAAATAASLIKNHLVSKSITPAKGQGNSISQCNTSDSVSNNDLSDRTSTPDFLQPRGPGRPRKGNKAQEISPCPECNKVFVRPDVLKLHYRSVHLNERHPCNLCPKIFKWPGDLSKHKRTKHPDKYPSPNAQVNVH